MAYRDFDAFENEVTGQPHSFKFHGEEYTFPHDLPYFTRLRLARLQKAKGSDGILMGAELYDMLRTMLGEDQLLRLEGAAPNDTDMERILSFMLNTYGGNDKDGASEAGNAVKRGKAKI